MLKLKSSSDGFAVVPIILTIVLTILIGLIALYIYLPKTPAQFHAHVKSESVSAASFTKKLADQIELSKGAIVNFGSDKGCQIESENKIGSFTNVVTCDYRYYVYQVGNGSMQDAITKLYDEINSAGWISETGASTNTLNNYLINPSANSPLRFQIKSLSEPNNLTWLYLFVFSSRQDVKAGPDLNDYNIYSSLTNKYLNGKNYIYGFVIDDWYYWSHCNTLICNTGT